MQPYTKAMDERNSLSVGINIRYPDSFGQWLPCSWTEALMLTLTVFVVIGPDMLDEGSLVDAQKIISCAFDVYKQWEPWTRPDDSRYTPRPLVIYLLTNSKNLRKEAMAAYPGVVVASQWEMMHIDSKNTTCVWIILTTARVLSEWSFVTDGIQHGRLSLKIGSSLKRGSSLYVKTPEASLHILTNMHGHKFW